jgi:hypothetical protein
MLEIFVDLKDHRVFKVFKVFKDLVLKALKVFRVLKVFRALKVFREQLVIVIGLKLMLVFIHYLMLELEQQILQSNLQF